MTPPPELLRLERALEAARDRYRELYEGAPVGYVTLDAEGRVTEANHRAHELLGAADGALEGRPIGAHLARGSEDALSRSLRQVAERGEPVAIELEVAARDVLGPQPLRVHLTPVGPPGRGEGCRCVLVDLSEVRAAHAYNRTVLDTALEGIVVCDERGRIESFNPVAERLFGHRASDVIRGDLLELLPERYREDYDRLLVPYGPGTGSLTGSARREVAGLRADGTTFPCELGIGEFDDAGKRRFVAVFRDLTAREDAARALHERETLLRQIAQYVEDVFVIHSRETRRLVYASPAFERVWGRPVSEALDGPSLRPEWIHASDREAVRAACRALARGTPFDLEFRIVRPDGEVRWVRGRTYAIRDPDGVVRRDAGVLRDITRKRVLEEELRQAQKMEAVGALASGVAHDFNNVLQGILGCLRIARDPGTPPAHARELLDHAAKAAQRGGELAARLTAFSRKREVEPAPVRVDEVVRGVAPLLERLLREPIELVLDLGAAETFVRADPVQLEQILMNLASNARDAMPSGGTLEIRTRALASAERPAECHPEVSADRYLSLVVRDTGTGMDEATRARIFDPFFTTKALGRGTGLGMATVFAITRRLGGALRVDSAPDAGTTFTICLPACEEGARPLVHVDEDTQRFTGRALVVEDDPLVRMSVSSYLESFGLDVFEAESAEDAGALIDLGAQLDLLVTDIVLPGARGSQLAQRLRVELPDLPVVYMTANPELVDEELPGGAVLCKPFGREALAQALEGLLGPSPLSRARRPRVLVVEDEPASRLALAELLRERRFTVESVDRPSRALALAESDPFDLLVTDMAGPVLAARMRSRRPDLRVIYVSGAAEAPADGDAFVTKPIDLDALVAAVERVLAP